LIQAGIRRREELGHSKRWFGDVSKVQCRLLLLLLLLILILVLRAEREAQRSTSSSIVVIIRSRCSESTKEVATRSWLLLLLLLGTSKPSKRRWSTGVLGGGR
jgi:hypothetical protein